MVQKEWGGGVLDLHNEQVLSMILQWRLIGANCL